MHPLVPPRRPSPTDGPGGRSARRPIDGSPPVPGTTDEGGGIPAAPEGLPMSRTLLQLAGLSLLAVLTLVGLECPTRGRPIARDEASDLQLVAGARRAR